MTTAGSLRVADADLYYELRGSGPLVVLVGAPMDARAFEPLAALLSADHTVLTTDPRGINRSTVDDRERDSTPELRAGDLRDLIRHVDAGPAAVLGSSGGAVSALALAQAHPAVVHTVIAHEPPLLNLLPDRAAQWAMTDEVIAVHEAGDHLAAFRKFLEAANIVLPEEVVLGMMSHRTPQDVADSDYQHHRMLRPTSRWEPDLAVLRGGTTRVVVGVGEESAGQLCDRTSRALTAELGTEPALFPGGHAGFAEVPEAFDVRLREVLAG
ncbi:alpha/beta fold hydrolase [Saccharothrix obliqua]|uniref:alpha/beta fold hydrolase n=1 Tax=Saccharothrix obliqua TaxID=2861747 RepID=UPI001C5E984B|nr:alpha/beta hydrolase [Saccharothrix obliqua]MBW4716968.1 alpha/beta hydrolase [Saccharothrix obliqua]